MSREPRECDEKRHQCGECITANKPYGGYDMGHVFINVNSDGRPTGWDRSQVAQKYLALHIASQHGTIGRHTPHHHQAGTSAVLLGRSSSASDCTDRSPRTSTDPLQPGTGCGGWRYQLPYWIGHSLTLDTAIGALAACYIGTQYHDESLIKQAQNMYLNTLQMMQTDLPEGNSVGRKYLLATILVMSSIELFMPRGGRISQLTHIEEATRLLRCLFEAPGLDGLHVYAFNQGLFEAISSRRQYEFSLPKYQPLIRKLFSVPRDRGSDLYFQWCEAISPLPFFLAAADRLISSSSPRQQLLYALLDDVRTLETRLSEWHNTFRAQIPEPWTFPIARTPPSSVGHPLNFISIEACTLFCLYWTSQVLLLDCIHTLYAKSASTSSAEAPSRAQIAVYAGLICRSVKFCTQDTSFAATENMLMPLCVVMGFYKRQQNEERTGWCRREFRRMAAEHGIIFTVEALGQSV